MQKVCYLLSGPAYTPYLICSLKTLRQHWNGLVEVYAWQESYDIVKRIADDSDLDVRAILRKSEVANRRKKWQFWDKIVLMQEIETDAALYLDADTTCHGNLDPYFEAARCGFVATQFCDWTTHRDTIKKRIRRLKEFAEFPDDEVDDCIAKGWPSPNGGIFACKPASPILREWERCTEIAMSIFIPDETVLHLMVHRHLGKGLAILTGNGRFNSSPKYQSKELADEDVVVRHYHGHSCVRPNKSQKGFDIWWPIFTQCLDENVGGMAEWISVVENKYLFRLMKEGLL